jgi:hypothetical protein
MDPHGMAYYPGNRTMREYPLDRFLPPIRTGIVSEWLKDVFPTGTWLLDPIGAHPGFSLEAARSGYPVLIACNNPILTFLTEILASSPKIADFKAALAELSALKRGAERLESHIRSLYKTECAVCKQSIEAEAYLWRVDDLFPFARIYHCPHCGDEGERPTTPMDHQRLELCGSDLLHRSRAAERICSKEDVLRPFVDDALRVYPRRQLYVLVTLVNRLEGITISPQRRKLLTALLISTFDEGNTLLPWPGARTRPRQLTIPPVYRENNLWLALEKSIDRWIGSEPPVPLTYWPDLPPPGGGICIFRGRLRALTTQSPPESIGAVLLCVPRPNQAFWILCCLWSGWLWGREAAQYLRASLERQRYDWNWHSTALYSALAPLSRWIKPGTPSFCLLTEMAPGFLAAMLTAAEASGLHLQQYAFRTDQDSAQLLLRSETDHIAEPGKNMGVVCQKGMNTLLEKMGEPCDYLQLYATALTSLAVDNALPRNIPQSPTGIYPLIQAAIAQSFNTNPKIRRFATSSHDIERTIWWLADTMDTLPPIKDRIEMELVRILQKRPGILMENLESDLCRLFPGFLTPSTEWIDLCLESYAETGGQKGDRWQLKSQDSPGNRTRELNLVREMIVQIGKRFEFQVDIDQHIGWNDRNGAPACYFYFLSSSIISRYILPPSGDPEIGKKVLVFPGGRSRLISYKLRMDPRLREAAAGWHFLKFRHLRVLFERKDLSRDNWEALLDSDPPFWNEVAQMTIF